MSNTINFANFERTFAPGDIELYKIYGKNDFLLWQGLPPIVQETEPFFLATDISLQSWSEKIGSDASGYYYKNITGLVGVYITPYLIDTSSPPRYFEKVITTVPRSNNSNRIYISIEGLRDTEWHYIGNTSQRVKSDIPPGLWKFVRFQDINGIYLYDSISNSIVSNTSKFDPTEWYYTKNIVYGFDWTNHLDVDVFSDSEWTTETLSYSYKDESKIKKWDYQLIRQKNRGTFIFTDEWPDNISTYLDRETEGTVGSLYLYMVKATNGQYLHDIVGDGDYNHYYSFANYTTKSEWYYRPYVTATHIEST